MGDPSRRTRAKSSLAFVGSATEVILTSLSLMISKVLVHSQPAASTRCVWPFMICVSPSLFFSKGPW